MPTRSTVIWKRLGKLVDYPFNQTFVRRFTERFDLPVLLEVDLYMEEYLRAFPSEKGASSAPFDLAKMIQAGDWPPSKEEAQPKPAVAVSTQEIPAINFTGDALLDEMPPLIQALVAHRLQGTEICVDFALAGALAIVGTCCGNRLRVTAWGDTYMVNDYYVLVGETGTSFKSSVLHRVRATVSDVAAAAVAPDEGSWERLIQHLADAPGSIYIRDELAGLLGEIKGKDYMRGMREMLLTLHNHAGIYRRGVVRAMYTVNHPALTLAASIQPLVLGEELVTGRHIESGLMNRLLIVCGQAHEKWARLEDPREMEHRIKTRLRMIADQGVVEVDASHLEDQANLWRGREEEEFGDYGFVARRASTHAIKLAAILQAADSWPIGAIEERWLFPALSLLERWFRATVALLERVHIKQAREIEKRDLLQYVERSKNGGRQMGEMLRQSQLRRTRVEEYLDELRETGQVRMRTEEDGGEHWYSRQATP